MKYVKNNNCFFKTVDGIIGLGLVMFSLVLLFYIIPGQVDSGAGGGLDPSFMPNLVAIITGVLGLCLVLGLSGDTKELSFFKEAIKRPVLVTVVMLSVYVFLSDILGYMISTALALLVFFFYFGSRSYKTMAILAVGVPLALYWFFAKIMLVMLPSGMFF